MPGTNGVQRGSKLSCLKKVLYGTGEGSKYVTSSDVNIEFFQNPDIKSEDLVKIRISDFI